MARRRAATRSRSSSHPSPRRSSLPQNDRLSVASAAPSHRRSPARHDPDVGRAFRIEVAFVVGAIHRLRDDLDVALALVRLLRLRLLCSCRLTAMAMPRRQPLFLLLFLALLLLVLREIFGIRRLANAIIFPSGDHCGFDAPFGRSVKTNESPPPIGSRQSWPGSGFPSFSVARTKTIERPSGDQRGDESRSPRVSCRGSSFPPCRSTRAKFCSRPSSHSRHAHEHHPRSVRRNLRITDPDEIEEILFGDVALLGQHRRGRAEAQRVTNGGSEPMRPGGDVSACGRLASDVRLWQSRVCSCDPRRYADFLESKFALRRISSFGKPTEMMNTDDPHPTLAIPKLAHPRRARARLLLLSGCRSAGVKGNGNIKTETRQIATSPRSKRAAPMKSPGQMARRHWKSRPTATCSNYIRTESRARNSNRVGEAIAPDARDQGAHRKLRR